MSIFGSPDAWVHNPLGLHYEICNYVEKLHAKLGIPFQADIFCDKILKDERTYHLTSSQIVDAFKNIVEEKIRLSKPVDGVISLNSARETKVAIETGKIDLNKITVDDVLARHRVLNPPPLGEAHGPKAEEAPHSNIAKPHAPTATSWEHITTGEKVNAGLWGVGAVMSVFGALGAARNSIARDEQDKPHIMWSQVGICLLQATAAAGCAYMGAYALHGRSIG